MKEPKMDHLKSFFQRTRAKFSALLAAASCTIILTGCAGMELLYAAQLIPAAIVGVAASADDSDEKPAPQKRVPKKRLTADTDAAKKR
jgi:hypothetical protein